MVTNQPTDGVILNWFINTVDDFFIFLPSCSNLDYMFRLYVELKRCSVSCSQQLVIMPHRSCFVEINNNSGSYTLANPRSGVTLVHLLCVF